MDSFWLWSLAPLVAGPCAGHLRAGQSQVQFQPLLAGAFGPGTHRGPGSAPGARFRRSFERRHRGSWRSPFRPLRSSDPHAHPEPGCGSEQLSGCARRRCSRGGPRHAARRRLRGLQAPERAGPGGQHRQQPGDHPLHRRCGIFGQPEQSADERRHPALLGRGALHGGHAAGGIQRLPPGHDSTSEQEHPRGRRTHGCEGKC